jgi:hypothetical protein
MKLIPQTNEEWLIVRRGMMFDPSSRGKKPFSNRIKFFGEKAARDYLEWVQQFKLSGTFTLYLKTETEYEIK